MHYTHYMALKHDKLFQMRVDTAFLKKVDDWRRQQSDLPPRAEAIRRLVEAGLGSRSVPSESGQGVPPAGEGGSGKVSTPAKGRKAAPAPSRALSKADQILRASARRLIFAFCEILGS